MIRTHSKLYTCIRLSYTRGVGHREALLTGAKRCLYERGYARTTSRDIVAASGTNLASIGYHFGSKNGLLFAAMSEAIEDWAAELGRVIAKTEIDGDATFAERLGKVVDGLAETLATHRALWIAAYEFVPQVVREPDLREQVAGACAAGRKRLAAMLLGLDDAEVNEEDERTVGALFFVLLSGLITQWLVDPHRAPDAGELLEGMRTAVSGELTKYISFGHESDKMR